MNKTFYMNLILAFVACWGSVGVYLLAFYRDSSDAVFAVVPTSAITRFLYDGENALIAWIMVWVFAVFYCSTGEDEGCEEST